MIKKNKNNPDRWSSKVFENQHGRFPGSGVVLDCIDS